MARHKLRKKGLRPGQTPGRLYLLRARDRRVTLVSHHAEDRQHGCGRCGHHWSWHDNVWLKFYVNEDKVESIEATIRCRGGYLMGLSSFACKCREVYPG